MKKYWQKTRADRTFKIIDLDCDIIVEHFTRKYMLGCIEDYIENLQLGYADIDTSYTIEYADGTYDFVNEEYDGHKIKKQNIVSIVEDNACTSAVFGNYSINECGVVSTSREMDINTENIEEIA